MPLGVSSVQWDMRMAWGSKTSWAFSMFQAGGIVPYDLTGHTFQYLVKTAPNGDLVFKINLDDVSNPAGTLVTKSNTDLSSVILSLAPGATSALSTPFQGYQALWMDFDDPDAARNVLWGQFFVDPSVLPVT